MTPSVDSASLCGDVRDPKLINEAGLGLVDFNFWPHFDADSVTQEQSKLSCTFPELYACPDGSGIVVDGTEVELFGQVHLYDSGVVRSTPIEE